MTKEVKKITIPKGTFKSNCCADCVYFDMDKRYGNECFCVKRSDWYKPTNSDCSDFRPR